MEELQILCSQRLSVFLTAKPIKKYKSRQKFDNTRIPAHIISKPSEQQGQLEMGFIDIYWLLYLWRLTRHTPCFRSWLNSIINYLPDAVHKFRELTSFPLFHCFHGNGTALSVPFFWIAWGEVWKYWLRYITSRNDSQWKFGKYLVTRLHDVLCAKYTLWHVACKDLGCRKNERFSKWCSLLWTRIFRKLEKQICGTHEKFQTNKTEDWNRTLSSLGSRLFIIEIIGQKKNGYWRIIVEPRCPAESVYMYIDNTAGI